MTARLSDAQLRRRLRQQRDDQGWTFQEFATEIQAMNGNDSVSSNTVRLFMCGASVTPRIRKHLVAYVQHLLRSDAA